MKYAYTEMIGYCAVYPTGQIRKTGGKMYHKTWELFWKALEEDGLEMNQSGYIHPKNK